MLVFKIYTCALYFNRGFSTKWNEIDKLLDIINNESQLFRKFIFIFTNYRFTQMYMHQQSCNGYQNIWYSNQAIVCKCFNNADLAKKNTEHNSFERHGKNKYKFKD